MRTRIPLRVVVSVLLAAAIGAWVWHRLWKAPDVLRRFQASPEQIMGTETELTAVAPRRDERKAAEALAAAESALRGAEAKMSDWLAGSEVSRLNAAPAGRQVPLSPQTLAVLRAARDLAAETDGAFDATCQPVIHLWRTAGEEKRLPTEADLAAARERSRWADIELLPDGVVKRKATAGVDLGGIAKGYAIDRAVEAMQAAGVVGGLVDVGGDIRCFGRRDKAGDWQVGVRNPFDPYVATPFAVLGLPEGSVCTSGNYFRYTEIDGRRYSHIVDPRTSRPVDFAPSVTVVGPTAMVADGWATALSVLGEEGFRLLPKGAGLEAMLVIGSPEDYRIRMTDGFRRLLVQRPPEAHEKRVED